MGTGDGRGVGAGSVGAFVLLMLAPVVVRILPELGVKIGCVSGICFCAVMWHSATSRWGDDYRH